MSNWYFWLAALPIASVTALTLGVCLMRSGACSLSVVCTQSAVTFGAVKLGLLWLRWRWWR